ncbi:2Fe-2S iron-sulfur cluster-binding protein [Bradyrhizobium canariense]|uniref:succinate dehydrogenase n=1 Tax=Bradyrhizobium canariense TaxID=255045 RepID=A0A1H1SR33_9BRAD|nr:2Fe-2S iron-sulfur cluster-binding protein [Bradyrhizobium canariense]SDS50381.1 succinate dehydrogenase / fumarate reductase iron-sulfur subunit [Bradyrhizobium canariense]
MKATLAIQRGTPAETPRVQSFDVAFEPGQSVLDGLRALRRESDPSLAFRFACINANACKECMMLIDGKVDYACTVRLKEGVTTLAPLPKKALIRDLVTEIAPPDERLQPSPPSISREGAIS